MPVHSQDAARFEPSSYCQWDRKAFQADADSSEVVDRKVKGLLNKLTMEKFDSISDQIIEWANKSENEKVGLSSELSNSCSRCSRRPQRYICSICSEDMVLDCHFCQLLNLSINEPSSNLTLSLSKQLNPTF